MAQLGLKEYVAKLDQLLSSESPDEAIQHSRHILKYFPKNVAVWRSLGRALVQTARWEEAESAIRRVLTVLPDDYVAHLGLSEAYTLMNRGDEAISHLERAFEQNPNSRELIDGLRGLYRRFRRADRVKIQLTAAAIARQHRRNNAPGQAIDVLRGALARTPDRLDLRLLLAETLWDNGARMDAAEIAVGVLKTLPDCLSANRIMTRLWLDAGRPSDATRFINRLEAVDPYLAYELVQGEPPPDDAFRVDEIDYQSYAEGELVSRRPDWLQSIGASAPTTDTSAEADQPAWLSEALSGLPTDQRTQRAAEQLEGDWMADVQPARTGLTGALNLPKEFSASQKDVTTGELDALFGDSKRGLTGALNLPKEFSASERNVPTGELDALFGDSGDDTLPDWMLDAQYKPTPPAPPADETPDLDVLFGSLDDEPGAATGSNADFAFNFALDDQPAQPYMPQPTASDFNFGFDDALTPNDEPDASGTPAWLLSDEDEDDEPALGVLGSSPSAVTADDDIPDWMRNTMEEDDAIAVGAPPATEPDEALDWLDDSLFEDKVSQPTATEKADIDPDPLAWLLEDESEDDRPFDPYAVSATASTASDWISEMDMNDEKKQPDASNDDSLDWLTSLDEQPNPSPTQSPDLPDLDALTPDDDLAWLSDARAAAKDAGADEDDLAWLSADDDAASLNDVAALGDATAAVGNDLEWLSADDDESVDEVVIEADMPDWLTQMQPEGTSLNEMAAATPMANAEAEPDDELSWLSEVETTVESTQGGVQRAAPSDELSWLSEVEAAVESTPTGVQGAIPSDELTWLSDDDEPAALASEIPDWMAGLEPETAISAAVDMPAANSLLDDDGMDWLSEIESTTPLDEPAVARPSTVDLAWLTPPEDEPVARPSTDDLAWLTTIEDEPTPMALPTTADLSWMPDEDTEEQPAIVDADMPDWLTGGDDVGKLDEPAAVALASTDDLAWMPSEQDTEVEAAVEPAEIPSWMSELEPETAAMAESDALETDEDDLAWLSNDAPAKPAAVSAKEGEFGWLTDSDDAPAAASTPEWLTELEQLKEPSGEETLLSYKPMLEKSDNDGAAIASVNDAPAWLTEIEPRLGDKSSEPEADALATGQDDFAWFDRDEEKLQPVASVDDTPDWLQAIRAEDEQAAEDDTLVPVGVLDSDTDDIDALMSEIVGDSPADDFDTLVMSEIAGEPVGDDFDTLVMSEIAGEPVGDDFDTLVMSAVRGEDTTPGDEFETLMNEIGGEPLQDEFDTRVLANADPEAAFASSEVELLDGITEAQAEPIAELVGADFSFEDEVGSRAPAENAPDWLNAMVPGLDVDYEAREDEVEAVEALEERAVPALKRDYDWVAALATAETALDQPATTRPRFVFSRPPAWLSGGSSSSKADDGLPDWISEDDSAPAEASGADDMPSWLK